MIHGSKTSIVCKNVLMIEVPPSDQNAVPGVTNKCGPESGTQARSLDHNCLFFLALLRGLQAQALGPKFFLEEVSVKDKHIFLELFCDFEKAEIWCVTLKKPKNQKFTGIFKKKNHVF